MCVCVCVHALFACVCLCVCEIYVILPGFNILLHKILPIYIAVDFSVLMFNFKECLFYCNIH